MVCPQFRQTLDLLAGTLTREQEQSLLEHFEACPSCRKLYKETEAAWDMLDDWQIPTFDTDLTPYVLARAQRPLPFRSVASHARARVAVLVRVAASVLLPIGLGIGAGQWVSRPSAPSAVVSADPRSAEEIAEVAGLTDVSIESATGLPLGFEQQPALNGSDES